MLLSRALSGTRTVVVGTDGRVLATHCETNTRLMQRILSRLDHRAGTRRLGQRDRRAAQA